MAGPSASAPARGRRDLHLALGLALVALLFRLPRLGVPSEEYFDEVYHAKTALEYLEGKPPTEWVHPPTAKLLIAVGVWLFGYEPWAWRVLPALCGAALAPVFFLLARRVLPTERAALFASLLLLSDGVYVVQSRIAMTNIFAVLFQLTATLFLVRSVLEERLPPRGMALTGVFLGLALSTRWTSLWAAGFLGLVLLAVRGRRLIRGRELLLAVLAFIALPVLLYVLSYVPWMIQGNHLGHLPAYTRAIWRYHADLRAPHPYFSAWYTWPWLVRPTWYFFQQKGQVVQGIVAIGNPALWWASVPVTVWALVSGFRARDPRRLFSGLGFCCMYLPWGISPRILNYSHYLFEALPYACLGLGLLMDRFWEGRLAVLPRAYLGLAALLFLFFYPFLTALPVPTAWYYFSLDGVRPWTWFPGWV